MINTSSGGKTHTLHARLCSHRGWALNTAELSLRFPWNPQLTEDSGATCPKASPLCSNSHLKATYFHLQIILTPHFLEKINGNWTGVPSLGIHPL